MFHKLASALLYKRTAAAVVTLCALLGLGSALLSVGVEQDDDLLAFLPPDNPDVKLFYDVNKRFGGLDVAIVGIESERLFSRDFLERLGEATDDINDVPEVAHALSMSNVQDFVADPMGGIERTPLIYPMPESPEDEAAMRDKVLARDHITGNLVSADGRAAVIYCFLAAEVEPRAAADSIRTIVTAYFPTETKAWGGAPFISTWIYETTQSDLDKLVPWAVLAIILILMFTFGDLKGTLLALLSTGMGIAMAVGLMAVLGVRYNIVLSSMPIILFAVGSAYSIHLLARYYRLEPELGSVEALRTSLTGLGPVIAASGLTTVAGLLSFLTMDIEPMRTFGLFTALGIFCVLVLSLTFVPAVIRLAAPKHKPRGPSLTGAVSRLTRRCVEQRVPALAGIGFLSLAALLFITRVETRMDTSAFFDPGSPPDRAERFLDEHVGGSQFIQLLVTGDMKDPAVLRELQFVSDSLENIDLVSAAVSPALPVSLANEAMEGIRRLPDTSKKVALLLGFLTGDRSVEQLITEDRTQSLIQLKLRSGDPDAVEGALDEVERFVSEHRPVTGPERRPLLVSRRVVSLSRSVFPALNEARVREHLDGLPAAADPEVLTEALVTFMGTEEFFAELPGEDEDEINALKQRLAAALAAMDPETDDLTETVATVLGLPPEDPVVDDTVFSIETPLEETRTRESAGAAASELLRRLDLSPPEGLLGERYRAALAGALTELRTLPEDPGPAAELSMQVSGLPVLYRGLSRSVRRNQIKSLASALVLVFLIMTALFRSVATGLLATAPTAVTLAVVYGAMGLAGVHLDIGTSMLAGLIIGAGVDYAVHLLAAWRAPDGGEAADGAEAAARATAPAIWTAAVMVAAGFFVLTLGEARPLQNVGMLTAAAMLVAALATFTVVPALARKPVYAPRGTSMETPS